MEILELFKECTEVLDACGKAHQLQMIQLTAQEDYMDLQARRIAELEAENNDNASPFVFLGLGLLVGFGMSKL